MRSKRTLVELSRRAPSIVVVTLCAALVGYWAEVPVWLPYGIAILVGTLALAVMASRKRQPQAAVEGDPDSDTSWLAQELAGKGSPAGSYTLAFLALVTIAVTGMQGAYALPAWAALALCAAWSIANARYGPRREAEPGPPN
jgi:hypothetical protein